MEIEIVTIIKQFVDYLLPELTPYESTMYLYLLRKSYLHNCNSEICIGKRTIAAEFGQGVRGERTSYAHVSEMLKNLDRKGCIKIGGTERRGTNYTIILPENIPIVAEKIATNIPIVEEDDYYTNPEKRKLVFERDDYICQYCGDKLTQNNITIDHYIPQSLGGENNKDNLRTCCISCNSIKSGKTYEEAAPLLLKYIQERRVKTNKY